MTGPAENRTGPEPDATSAKPAGVGLLPNEPAADLKDRIPRPPRQVTPIRLVVLLIGIAFLYWSFSGTGFSPVALAEGLPGLWDLLTRIFPPDWSIMPSLVEPILETVRMAIVGAALAAVLALPLGFLAARNITPHPAVRGLLRPILNALRTIPELIFALLFVAAVGLGPFAGVMALLLGGLGFLGKIYAETLESIDPRPVDALQGLGATRAQAAELSVADSRACARCAPTINQQARRCGYGRAGFRRAGRRA